MKRALFLLGLLLASPAAAQAPSPAQMGITPTTVPEVLQTLDNTQTWVPLGTVDPSTHTFTPVGGGGGGGGALTPIPNDTVLGNATSSAALPQALSLPSCASLTSALTYTLGTGFGCNIILRLTPIAANTVLGNRPALPLSRSASRCRRVPLQATR